MSRTDWTDADLDRHYADLDVVNFERRDNWIDDAVEDGYIFDAQLADDADMADAQWGSRFMGWGAQAVATEG